MKIIKTPEYENDDMLLEIKNFTLDNNELSFILSNDNYTNIKFNKFYNRDISIDGFDLNRPSLRTAKKDSLLDGSIYTFAVESRNNMSYENCLKTIKIILDTNTKSRKAVLRFANNIGEYYDGELGKNDVSCLNLIHYYNESVKLIFRASDIKNELFTDIITIYWFFIKPIFNKADIKIYASTSQNVKYLNTLENKIKEALK